MGRWAHRIPAASGRLVLLALVLSACNGSIGDSDSDPTPSPRGASPPTTASAENTASEPAGATATPEASAPIRGSSEPRTATTESTADATAVVRATSTMEPLPEAGQELQIEGEDVTLIIQGSDNGRTIYAAADERLWRSNDGGRTWSDAGEGDVGSVIVALNEPNVLYSGDRGTCGRGFSFQDFRRSSDAGRNWETIEANRDIEPYLAYETPQSAFLYGSNCGLSASADGGESWLQITDLNGEEIFAVATQRSAPMEELLVVGVTEGGTGRLFLLDNGNPAAPQFVSTIAQFWGNAAVDWTNGRIVLATASAVGVSDDRGASWIWSREGLEDATFSVDPLFEAIPDDELDPFRSLDFVRIDPIDRDRIWVGGVHGAYLSTDGGLAWERVGPDEHVTGLVLSTLTDRAIISTETGTRLWSLSET
jgi:hypothetical protein